MQVSFGSYSFAFRDSSILKIQGAIWVSFRNIAWNEHNYFLIIGLLCMSISLLLPCLTPHYITIHKILFNWQCINKNVVYFRFWTPCWHMNAYSWRSHYTITSFFHCSFIKPSISGSDALNCHAKWFCHQLPNTRDEKEKCFFLLDSLN